MSGDRTTKWLTTGCIKDVDVSMIYTNQNKFLLKYVKMLSFTVYTKTTLT